jgi:hypothetical protein
MDNLTSPTPSLPSTPIIPLPSCSWSTTLILLLRYLLIVRALRFRRLHALKKKHAALLKDPYAMPYKTAHAILKLHMLSEMPYIHSLATQWALPKTYGIASGTKLLVQTRQLTSESKVGKRAEDTGVLLVEILVGDIDSERGMRALSKINWLHARYKKVISNDEMLHTLAMFVLEPIRFIQRYEWRGLTELERVARFVYWREIGLRMGMVGIPGSLGELEEWTERYEAEAMVFAESNRACADTTIELYLEGAPRWLHGFVRSVTCALLEERVLRAVGWADPPEWVVRLVVGTLRVRAWMIRHLFLPRLWDKDPVPKQGEDGRLYRNWFVFEPWYIKDNTWRRWMTWLGSKGRLCPGEDFKSTGYLPEELGPVEFEKASKEPVRKQAEAMREYVGKSEVKGFGCPFAFGDELCWRK